MLLNEQIFHQSNIVITDSIKEFWFCRFECSVVWRAVRKNLYLVSPQMGNKGIYKCFRCVYHDLRLRSSRLLVRQAIVCVCHVNQYTPCPPKLCAFKSATSLLPFRPNSRHHVHFTSCTLKATRYIHIYVKCQEVSPHGSQQVVL